MVHVMHVLLCLLQKLSDETTPNFNSRKNLYHTYAKIYITNMPMWWALDITHNNYLKFVGITRKLLSKWKCHMQCEFDLLNKKYNLYKNSVIVYFNWGILFVFVVFFVYNFELYKDIHVLQGNLQPVNKKFWCHDISAQVCFISASFEILWTVHFRRQLRCVDCRFYREPDILKQVILWWVCLGEF